MPPKGTKRKPAPRKPRPSAKAKSSKTSPEQASPSKGGRPPLELDESVIYQAAAILCTNEEIALLVGCSEDTLVRRFADLLKKGRAAGKMSLRRVQFKKALAGDTTAMIWLGKNILGQRDKVEVENTNPTGDPLRNVPDDDLDRQLAEAERAAAAAASRKAPAPSVN